MEQNYRNNDPPTSREAGSLMESQGIASRHRKQCLETVTRFPGMTAREIEAQTNIKAHKRLPELREDGIVRNGPSRECSISRRQAMTWYLATGKSNIQDLTA